MAQHGYARDYDEDFGGDRDDRRERGENWRDQGDDDRHDRGGFMFDERDRHPESGIRGAERFGASGDYREGRRGYSSHPDDHYRSWRQRQIDALDRDYEDYCREREQQFHQDFDSWRSNRRQQSGGSNAEMGELELTQERAAGGASGPDPMSAATLGTNNSETGTANSPGGRTGA